MTIAVSHAWQGKAQSSLAVASQSAMHSVFLIAPILIVLTAIVGVATISLFYNLFVVAVIGLVVYLFQKVTEDGEATWFEGASLLGLFTILGLVAFYFG
jgi:Ca2+:H+ antiporter